MRAPPFSGSLGDSETRTLGNHVSPPSNDAAKRTKYPACPICSRRSYQVTPTTPYLFTATLGWMWFGPSPGSSGSLSSLTTIGFDHVFPLSDEYASRISYRPERPSVQTT